MIKTKNPTWGFYGTAQSNYDFSDPVMTRLFDATAQMLQEYLKLPMTQIICFLDSKYGRHFADELSFHGAQRGNTPTDFIHVVRDYLKKIENKEVNGWVAREAKSQEIYQ